jgi:hypothetical protein
MQPFPKGLDFSEIPDPGEKCPGKKLTAREKENTLEENA